jgi:hypothetical protein
MIIWCFVWFLLTRNIYNCVNFYQPLVVDAWYIMHFMLSLPNSFWTFVAYSDMHWCTYFQGLVCCWDTIHALTLTIREISYQVSQYSANIPLHLQNTETWGGDLCVRFFNFLSCMNDQVFISIFHKKGFIFIVRSSTVFEMGTHTQQKKKVCCAFASSSLHQ